MKRYCQWAVLGEGESLLMLWSLVGFQMNNPGYSPTTMCIWTTVIDSKDKVVMEDNECI